MLAWFGGGEGGPLSPKNRIPVKYRSVPWYSVSLTIESVFTGQFRKSWCSRTSCQQLNWRFWCSREIKRHLHLSSGHYVDRICRTEPDAQRSFWNCSAACFRGKDQFCISYTHFTSFSSSRFNMLVLFREGTGVFVRWRRHGPSY